MSRGFFVTGTDTGVGKTLISAALVHGFAQRGFAVAGMKPVAAGCRSERGMLLSEDVELLKMASNVPLPLHIINPFAFAPPLAPHIAAQQLGVRIELAAIDEAFRQAAAATEILLVEGVGGFCVPVNDTQSMADVAVMLGCPVILVVGMRLGCLNHALLTVEAILARGLTLAGWIANCTGPDMPALGENMAALEMRIPAPRLGTVPFQVRPDYATVSSRLEFGGFLHQSPPCDGER
jgi:dethiobiotin synthetase